MGAPRAMLIQEFTCPDSIVAYQLVLVEFCNTIGTKRLSADRPFRSGLTGKPDITEFNPPTRYAGHRALLATSTPPLPKCAHEATGGWNGLMMAGLLVELDARFQAIQKIGTIRGSSGEFRVRQPARRLHRRITCRKSSTKCSPPMRPMSRHLGTRES